ncbi:MAG: fructosamine kinase family protein [Bacteroidota bacterium]
MGIPSVITDHLCAAGWVSKGEAQPVFGGDIAQSYKLTTNRGAVFLKYVSTSTLPYSLRVEAEGLAALRRSKTIAVPVVLHQGNLPAYSYLALPWLQAGPLPAAAGFSFGQAMASLHQTIGPFSGWEKPNLLGRLAQNNTPNTDWPSFWQANRIEPHLQAMQDQGLLPTAIRRSLQVLQRRLNEFLPAEGRSLLHGDLWSGNFLFEQVENRCYLIDPSTYYGHYEVDLAMTELFGGFPSSFYEGYHAGQARTAGWQKRQAIYQLYYLTAHVLLFGSSYLSRVASTLQFILKG